MAVGNGVAFDTALHMIMLYQSIHHILHCAVVRVGTLDAYNLPKLVLECFLASCLHLPFCKGFFIAALSVIVIIIISTNGTCKSSLHTLLPEKLTHIMQVSFISPECPASINMAVADQEMNVLMRFVCMYRKQHLIAPKVFLCKLLCDAEYFIIGELVIVLRRKRNGHFECKVCIA